MLRGVMGALGPAVVLAILAGGGAPESGTVVKDNAGLRAALRALRPGTTLLLAPGEYEGGHLVAGAAGTEKEPIVIRGADPANPPVFRGGGSEALHFTDAAWVRLADLRVAGYAGNGINVDDGGTFETPSRRVTIERVSFEDIGPGGNHDALKMSGVVGFLVKGCRFEGWGGSAIDLVGCRDGIIEDCSFLGGEGVLPPSAVQLKGGTRDVLVHLCWFRDCAERGVNLGGSTGLAHFRPAPGEFEATGIAIAGNRFHGCLAPVAWVTASGGKVVRNTFHRPRKWALRILQESTDPRFRPCREGVFEGNLVVLGPEVATVVNVGPGTAPESFAFRGNVWFVPGSARPPALPVAEEEGVHGVDPILEDPGGPGMRITSKDRRLRGVGADAYEPPAKK